MISVVRCRYVFFSWGWKNENRKSI